MVRNLVMGTVQLSSYDQLKGTLLKRNWEHGVKLYSLCGFLAGAVAVAVGSPLDVIRSRRMVVREENIKSARSAFFSSRTSERHFEVARRIWLLPRRDDDALEDLRL